MSFLLVNVEVFFSCSGSVRFYTDPDPSDPFPDFMNPGAIVLIFQRSLININYCIRHITDRKNNLADGIIERYVT